MIKKLMMGQIRITLINMTLRIRKKILISVIIFTALTIILIVALKPKHKLKALSISESKWNKIN